MENSNEGLKAESIVKSIEIRKLLYFVKGSLNNVVAAKPDTGSAVVYNQRTSKWDYSDKDYYQIVADTNYHQISEEYAKSIYGDNWPKFGFLDLLDAIKERLMSEGSKTEK